MLLFDELERRDYAALPTTLLVILYECDRDMDTHIAFSVLEYLSTFFARWESLYQPPNPVSCSNFLSRQIRDWRQITLTFPSDRGRIRI